MKFTILTSCYNNAPFLEEYFSSLFSQKYDNLEVVFVNDASTDSSLAIAQKWAHKLPIKIISNSTRLYCGGSYNVALSHATGEVCGVVDADDALLKNAIDIIVQKYRKNPSIDFIYTQHYWCNKNLQSRRSGLSSLPQRGKSLSEMAFAGKHCFSHWRTFRTFLRDRAVIFPTGLKYSVDKNMGFVLEEIGHGGFLPITLYCYRYHPSNMSLTNGKNQKLMTKMLAGEFMNNKRKKNPIIKIR